MEITEMLKAIHNNSMYIEFKSGIKVDEIKVNLKTLDELHTINNLVVQRNNGAKEMCGLRIIVDIALKDYEFKLTVSDIEKIL